MSAVLLFWIGIDVAEKHCLSGYVKNEAAAKQFQKVIDGPNSKTITQHWKFKTWQNRGVEVPDCNRSHEILLVQYPLGLAFRQGMRVMLINNSNET